MPASLSREPAELTATETLAAFAAGRLTAEDYAKALLDRCRRLDWLNALIGAPSRSLLDEAAAADRRRREGRRAGPLDGLPLLIKDNIDLAGWVTTAGAPSLADYRPLRTAPVAAALLEAGALVLGKTNMHEMAYGITSNNGAYGPVRNPYDVRMIAGGSSGGTAAAVAARMGPAGLGSDTGGSVRIPSALCGIAGLRPTAGRYPQAGIAPISHTRDTAGPMASTMADVAILDRAIAGGGAVAPANLREVRIGVEKTMLANLDGDTEAAFRASLDKLKSAGVTVVDIEMPKLAELNGQVGFPVALYEAYDDMVVYLKKTGTGITIEQLAKGIASPDVKGTYDGLVIPRKLPAPDNKVVDAKPAYDAAIKTERPALQALYRDTFAKNKLDAIAFPTTPKVAIAANPDSSSLANFLLFIQNTDPGSNAGVPGIQLPIALGATSKLPVGLELDGPAGSDRKLLAVGMAFEKIFGRLPAPSAR